MSYEKFWLIMNYGSLPDKIILLAKLIGIVILFISIVTIAINTCGLKGRIKRLENELHIANRHLNGIDKTDNKQETEDRYELRS